MKQLFKRASLKRRSLEPSGHSVSSSTIGSDVSAAVGAVAKGKSKGEPDWETLYPMHCEEPDVLERIQGSPGRLKAEGFARLWAAVLGEDAVSELPAAKDLSKVFRTVFVVADDGTTTKAEFDLRAHTLWQVRSTVGALPGSLRTADAEVIDQILPPKAKQVPKHMLTMLFQQFTTGGASAEQFTKLYAAVAKQYQMPGAGPEDVAASYDPIVLASVHGSVPLEATFVKRFNIIWQRQDELGTLTRMVVAAAASEDGERAAKTAGFHKFEGHMAHRPISAHARRRQRAGGDGTPRSTPRGSMATESRSRESSPKAKVKAKGKISDPWGDDSPELDSNGEQVTLKEPPKIAAKGVGKIAGKTEKGSGKGKPSSPKPEAAFPKSSRNSGSSDDATRPEKPPTPWEDDTSDEDAPVQKPLRLHLSKLSKLPGTHTGRADDGSSEASFTPRGSRKASSYAEERRKLRARPKATTPGEPEVTAKQKPMLADELPEDSPDKSDKWAGCNAGELRFAQWPGTARWAESLDDASGRAVHRSVAELAAERSMNAGADGAADRRLRSLLEGPHPSLPDGASQRLPVPRLLPPGSTWAPPVPPGGWTSPPPLPPPALPSPSPSSVSPRARRLGRSPGRSPGYGPARMPVPEPSPAALPQYRPASPVAPPARSLTPVAEMKVDPLPAGQVRDLTKDPAVFREMLCVVDELSAHWIANEMMATILPSHIQPVDPQSRDPMILEALARCAPEVPPLLYVSLTANEEPEVLLRHPFQEVFDQTVALACLMEKSVSPDVLLSAAKEAWSKEYNEAVTCWREKDVGRGYINSKTGENCSSDPRQHLLRELQLGCRLMAMLSARSKTTRRTGGR